MNPLELFRRDGRAILYEGAVDSQTIADENAVDPQGIATGQATQSIFETLRDGLDWKEEHIRIFGRQHPVPRLVAFYGDHAYRYSGIEHPSRPMPAPLRALRSRAEQLAKRRFDSVLCNYYRHGQDSMGYHRDNEPEIDPGCIASFSFGATRRFKLRHRPSGEVVTIDLKDGTLLLMLDCQEHWEHAIPKTRRPVDGRINLTFRAMRTPR